MKIFPSYVKDTTDFIKKIENFHSDNEIILLSMDVSGLYSNIPNQEGKEAVYRTLLQNGYAGTLSLTGLMKLLNCVLQKNNFEFGISITSR